MRNIPVYYYHELPEEIQSKVLVDIMDQVMEDNWSSLERWACDDCALLEPPHDEMSSILGEDYYEKNRTQYGRYGQFVFKNLRVGLDWDWHHRSLKFANGLQITNSKMFLIWLGIPERFHRYINYRFEDFMPISTTRIIWMSDTGHSPIGEAIRPLLDRASHKFSRHCVTISRRVQTSIEELARDQALEILGSQDIEFLGDGTRFAHSKAILDTTIPGICHTQQQLEQFHRGLSETLSEDSKALLEISLASTEV